MRYETDTVLFDFILMLCIIPIYKKVPFLFIMIYPRQIENEVFEHFDDNKAVVITGMRRVGKTTLLKKIFDLLETDNKIWFDFENPLDVEYFSDIDYNDVFVNLLNKGLDKNKRMFVFIDEIQNYPEISRVIKYLVDHYNVKFFVTGSSSFYLKNLFPESLAGRKVVFELFPLNFREFLIFHEADIDLYDKLANKVNVKIVEYEQYDKLYEEFVEWGGFPEVVLEEKLKNKKLLLNDIFSSYYQKEIIGLSDYRKSSKVKDLILLLARRVGSKLDISRISQELGISRVTVYNYLSFLRDTYFIFLVSPFSKSVNREISGRQKVYLCDNGILNIVSGMSSGALLENAVFNQLKFKGKVNYYQRPKSGNEIDFIVNQAAGFEVKKTATESDIKKILSIGRKLSLTSVKVVSQNYTDLSQKTDYVAFAQFL